MASSPALGQFARPRPISGPAFPTLRDQAPFPTTISRLPENERRLPEPRVNRSSAIQWEHVAAGALGGFGAGFAWAVALLTFAP